MIFGPDEESEKLGDPRYDNIMNMTYAVLVIASFIISGILNPILLWFHCSTPKTIPSILFRMLNFIDFTTTTLLCPFLAYGLLDPKLIPHNVDASMVQRIYSAVFAFLLFLSVSITTLMTATRVCAIKYPLKTMGKKQAIVYPMAGLITAACSVVVLNFIVNKTWDRYLFSTNRLKLVIFKPGTTHIDNWPEFVYTGILMPIAIAGCVCAVITGKEVYNSAMLRNKVLCIQRSSRNRQHRSYITVLMLSAGIQIALIFVFAQLIYSLVVARSGFSYVSFYFMYANALFCSLVLSVVNPIITLSRSSGLKRFYSKKIHLFTASHFSEETAVPK